MTYLLAKATVEDFDAWKSSFESNESIRTENGQRGYQTFRSLENRDEIVVLFDWDDQKDPRAFFKSEGMRKRMAEAGVQGVPEMTAVEMIDQKSALEPSA